MKHFISLTAYCSKQPSELKPFKRNYWIADSLKRTEERNTAKYLTPMQLKQQIQEDITNLRNKKYNLTLMGYFNLETFMRARQKKLDRKLKEIQKQEIPQEVEWFLEYVTKAEK